MNEFLMFYDAVMPVLYCALGFFAGAAVVLSAERILAKRRQKITGLLRRFAPRKDTWALARSRQKITGLLRRFAPRKDTGALRPLRSSSRRLVSID